MGMFHEIGHALVDILKLPVTGREEDAVDQFAVYYLIKTGRSDKAMRSAVFISEYAAINEQMWWSAHSFNAQRFANVLCWVYGSDPAKHLHLVTDGFLPAQRAGYCEDEYKLLEKSWETLLEKFLH